MGWRRLFGNILSLGAMRVASSAASFVVVVMFARQQGPALLGEFSTLQGIFAFLQLMPLMGLHVVLIRDIAAYPERSNQLITSATFFAMGIGVVLGLGVAVTGVVKPGTSREFAQAALMVACSMLPTAWICVAESVLIGRETMQRLARWNIMENFARALASIAVLLAGQGLVALFSVFFICRVWLAWAYWHHEGLGKFVQSGEARRQDLRQFLGELPVFSGIMICAASLNRLDFLLMYALAPMEEIGIYAAAYRFYELALMLPTLLLVALFPALSNAFRQKRQEFELFLLNSVRIALLVLAPGAILGWALAPELILVFGKRYDGAAAILTWLVVSLPMVGVNQCLAAAMLAMHRQRTDLVVVVCSATTYALLLWWWIGSDGAVGAAWATTAVAIMQPLLRLCFLWTELLGSRIMREVKITLMALAVMALPMVLLWCWQPYAALGIGVFCYCTVLFGMGITPQSLLRARRMDFPQETG